MRGRTCQATTTEGRLCRARPSVGAEFCFAHDPASWEEAQQARRLGGLRRRREAVSEGTYEFEESIVSHEGLERVLTIALIDTLAQENSLHRSQVLVSIVHAAARVTVLNDHERRLAAIEAALGRRL